MTNSTVLDAVPAQWRPIAKAKTYELVLDRIEEQILRGELAVGDRLPPERELAARLGVSRPAVREALRALQAQGVIHSSVGNSAEAGTVVVNGSRPALTRLLRLHVALAGVPATEVLQARLLLERSAARLAAGHATSADYQELAGLLARMADPELDRDGFRRLDAEFHAAVGQAAGNRVLADLTDAARGAAPATDAFDPDPEQDWRAAASQALEEHRAVYDRIATGDGAGAASLMEAHLLGACTRL
jgi:GntR family transcriptional regulator, transcriptional repressor for pyruvate dehydrogenase complex